MFWGSLSPKTQKKREATRIFYIWSLHRRRPPGKPRKIGRILPRKLAQNSDPKFRSAPEKLHPNIPRRKPQNLTKMTEIGQNSSRPPSGPRKYAAAGPPRPHPLTPCARGALLINVFFGTLSDTAPQISIRVCSENPGGSS